jgi:hypothetical protein
MATSFRIRPNTYENKLSVVKATFTNPATDIPASAVAVVVGANVPGHSDLQKMNRIRQCIDTVRENDQFAITASQYMKVTVPYGDAKGQVTIADVAGIDTADEGNLTIYVGSEVEKSFTQYLDNAFNYIRDYMLEDAKAA